MTSPPPSSPRLGLALLAVVLAVLLWSGVAPYDRYTWVLEVVPVVIAVPLLLATRRRFPLSSVALVLIALHAVVLMVGGHWTYARVPLGDWVRDLLGWDRNPYDRLGHLFQGFVPALIARELLLRTSPLRPGRWLFFLCTCVGLAISATYELLEWLAAEASGEAAEAFLGTQGDVWDTQWDMLLALVGALLAQLTLARVQDRQLGLERA